MPDSDLPSGPNSFPTTAWGLIRIVQLDGGDAALQAMNRLIASYWKPVFYFLRARGFPLHQAQDLTQEFFTRLVEKKDWLQRADPKRGRFRTFLLVNLKSFVADATSPDRVRRQFGFENRLVSVEHLLADADRTFEPSTQETPETIFMKQWAAALIDQVLHKLKDFYQSEGRPQWYEVFAAKFLDQDAGRPTQEALGERHDLSRDQVRYALEIVETRFKQMLREEVHDQVESEAAIGEEIDDLLLCLGR